MIKKIQQNFLNWFKNERKFIFISTVLAVIFTAIVTYTAVYSESVQSGIAKEVLRFHVLANSDEQYDQNLKLKVRDEILSKYKNKLIACQNVDETKKFFEKNIDDVILTAKDVIKREGYTYDVNAFLGKSEFPTKAYGDVVFPAGEYDALRIEIGNAEGKNWWCVMFPPLCFVDVSIPEIPENEKQKLKNILTDEEYGIVANPQNSSSFKIKFKIVEIWEEIFG